MENESKFDRKALKLFRLSMNLSQKDFAKEVNVTQQLISYVESGKRAMSNRLSNRIIHRFNVTDEKIEAIKSFKTR